MAGERERLTDSGGSGFLVMDLAGQSLSEPERERLQHPAVAGVILFSRNFNHRPQLCELVAELRAQRPDLLIMADQEGGRVQRFRGQGFTPVPAMGKLGQLWQQHPERAQKLASEIGWLLAAELLATGIDLGLAPVLDLDRGWNRVIGDRGFSASPEVVAALACAFMDGVKEAGMACVGKHFPGHGGVRQDSHIALPVDQRELRQLQDDISPFKQLITAGLSGVMPAHIRFPAVDRQSAGFSRVWLQDILRQQCGFQGAIISDCLSMAGASIGGSVPERVALALKAGCDLTLVCNNPEAVVEVLTACDNHKFEALLNLSGRAGRLQALYGRKHQHWQQLERCSRRADIIAATAELL